MYVNIAHRYDGVGQRNQIDLKKKKKQVGLSWLWNPGERDDECHFTALHSFL